MEEKVCIHCKQILRDEREIYIACCFVCRRYALLLGIWPENEVCGTSKAPEGWCCTRNINHDGPCAAVATY